MDIILYGIKNCDTIKKAITWLKKENIAFTFHDYRKDGISLELLTQFEQALGFESLINKRGTTFRSLSDQQKNNLDKSSAIDLMLAQPAMIKRPILYLQSCYYLGFKPEQYMSLFHLKNQDDKPTS